MADRVKNYSMTQNEHLIIMYSYSHYTLFNAVYLFILVSFNDAFNSSAYIESNDRMISE
jgi:hypothetical protein